MSTGTPNNMLDFNRAKLVARISEISPHLTPGNDLPSRLTQKLQMTLDIGEQLKIFVEALSELIEVEGVRYLNENPHVHLQSERMGVHRCHYNLTLPDCTLGEISFGRSRRFLEPELKVIEQMLALLVFPLRNALLYKQALDLALTDQLTALNNKRAFDQHILRELELARRHDHPLSLILIDLDFFKKVNDQYGHQAGDQVLMEVAARIRKTCRHSDLCFRLGGEEFAVILSQTDSDGAWTIAERIREAIASQPIQAGQHSINMTASLGLASYSPDEGRDELVRRADIALYAAKRDGRNRSKGEKSPAQPLLCGTAG